MNQKNDEFPYDQFPCKLVYKDGKENKICYFQSEDHLNKHITRYKIKKKDCTISLKNKN
jgi:hypothetical protein